MTLVIDRFHGEFEFLSNFQWIAIKDQGMIFPSVEHAFQAAKTTDRRFKRLIGSAPTPGQAKRLGRSVTLRKDWEIVKDEVMLRLLRLKFENEEMRKLLLETGDAELIEGNSWGDWYWGMIQYYGEMDLRHGEYIVGGNDRMRWRGQNKLGKLLMKVREEIRGEA